MRLNSPKVFYIPNVGYVFNEKIWLRFEKLLEHLYNECNECSITVDIYDESCKVDRFCKESWITCLNFAEVKYQDVD